MGYIVVCHPSPDGVEPPLDRVRHYVDKAVFQQAIIDVDAQWGQNYLEARNHAATMKIGKETTAKGEE